MWTQLIQAPGIKASRELFCIRGPSKQGSKLPQVGNATNFFFFFCRDGSHGGLLHHNKQPREKTLNKLSAILSWTHRHTDAHNLTSASRKGFKQLQRTTSNDEYNSGVRNAECRDHELI